MSEDEITRFEVKWKEIYTEGIEKVFRIAELQGEENFNLNQYTKLYTTAYDICLSKSSIIQIKCYERLCETMKNYCIRIYEKMQLRYSSRLLQDFVSSWTTFEEIVLKWILKFFSYFTRPNFRSRKNLNLETDLKTMFKEQVYDKISNDLLEAFFQYKDSERRGEVIDFSILRKFVKFLNSIEVSYQEYLYNSELEAQILENVIKFYIPLSQDLMSNNDYSSYLTWGYQVLEKEEERLGSYLPAETVIKAIILLKENIFFKQSSILLKNGLKELLVSQNLNELQKSFQIFSQDQKSLDIFLNIFKGYIKEYFQNLIEKNTSQITTTDGPREVVFKTNFVDDFINFYGTNMKIINEAFNSSNIFNVAHKEVLENVQSSNLKFNNSYLLPFYLDKILKKSPNNHTTDATKMIDNIIGIFPSLPDKDIFIEVHRNLLCHRLLNEDFISLDLEKILINKIKLICGVNYTSNIEAMVSDYCSNKDLNESYKIWSKNHQNVELQLYSHLDNNFSVLNTEVWPKLNVTKINLPPVLKYSIDQFYRFYRETFNKKQLQWVHTNSIAEVEGKLPSKSHIFVVNTVQAVILLHFNEFRDKEVSLDEINSQLGNISEPELKSAIAPLISSKLLIKLEKEGDFVKLNTKFMFNSKKVKITSSLKNEELIRKDKIEDDRSAAIEATIIRVMKANQRIHHNDLIQKVLEQLDHFKIQIQTIKKKITNLMEREFIKRDKDDANYYLYSTN